MNNALIIAAAQIEIEDATADLIAFVKANPIKRNAKSGTLNGNAMGAVAKKFLPRFKMDGTGQLCWDITGKNPYTLACEIIEANA